MSWQTPHPPRPTFVAAVAQAGVPLGKGYTVNGLVRYALMFLLIWWAWLGHTHVLHPL